MVLSSPVYLGQLLEETGERLGALQERPTEVADVMAAAVSPLASAIFYLIPSTDLPLTMTSFQINILPTPVPSATPGQVQNFTKWQWFSRAQPLNFLEQGI